MSADDMLNFIRGRLAAEEDIDLRDSCAAPRDYSRRADPKINATHDDSIQRVVDERDPPKSPPKPKKDPPPSASRRRVMARGMVVVGVVAARAKVVGVLSRPAIAMPVLVTLHFTLPSIPPAGKVARVGI